MSRFLLAVGLLVYSSLLQLPPPLPISLSLFSPPSLPGGVFAAPNCPALLWSSNAGGPEASESTICVLMSYFMCQQ